MPVCGGEELSGEGEDSTIIGDIFWVRRSEERGRKGQSSVPVPWKTYVM